MKATIMAVIFAGVCAIPAFAADNGNRPQGPGQGQGPGGGQGQNYEQRKAEILKHIDQKIARNQEEKGCVQAAKSHDDLKACREKFRAEMNGDRQGSRP